MKKLPEYLTKEEFKELIKATKQKHHKIAFLLGFGAGMRISEVINLKPELINFDSKQIKIIDGKGGKDRVVPIPKGFKPTMVKYIPIKCSIRALQIAFKRSCEKAGLLKDKPNLHFHSLRHSFGTLLAGSGMPIHYIRTLMGHSNISVTNIYLQANPKDALESYEDNF